MQSSPFTASTVCALLMAWPPSTTADGTLSTTSSAGGYTLAAEFTPSPVPVNQYFRIELRIQPAGAKSLPDRIEVDASMPGHGHGMNTQLVITPLPDGRYRVDGLLFHLLGRWRLEVDLIKGRKAEKAVFDLMIE